MRFFVLSLLLGLGLGALFLMAPGGIFLSAYAAPLLAVLSIFAAAVLLRLNRGIPAIDWKAVEPNAISNLVEGFEAVAKEYIAIFSLITFAIVLVFASVFVDNANDVYELAIQQGLAGVFGLTVGIVLGRMSYVVWRDLDIVRLQKVVILSAASAETAKREVDAAQEKLAGMNAARLPKP